MSLRAQIAQFQKEGVGGMPTELRNTFMADTRQLMQSGLAAQSIKRNLPLSQSLDCLRKINNRLPFLRVRQQVERRQQHFLLPRPLPWRAKWAPHQVRRHYQAGQTHGRQAVAEGGHPDHHRRHAPFFQQACNVSHGHMTDRSDRHQDDSVDGLCLQALDPLRPGAF